jgi:hypothetical protein
MPFLRGKPEDATCCKISRAPMNVATDLLHRSVRAEASPEPASNLRTGKFCSHPRDTKFNDDDLRSTDRGSAGARRRTVVKHSVNGKVGKRRSRRSDTSKETGNLHLHIGDMRRRPGPRVLDKALTARYRRQVSLNRGRLADRRLAGTDGEAKPGRHANGQRTNSEDDERGTTPPAPLAVETCAPHHVENLPSDCFQHRRPRPGKQALRE